MFDRQPTLTDETVRIRPLTAEDRDPLYAVASDPGIWAMHIQSNRHERPIFEEFFADSMASGGGLLIEEAATGHTIGHTRLEPDARHPDAIEIGWTFLARDHWGTATNARVKRLLLDHCHRTYPYVTLHVAGDNFRSRRAVEKIGGRLLKPGEPLWRLRREAPNYNSYGVERPAN